MGEGSASDLFYRWQVPGKTVTANLSLKVVERLGRAIRKGVDDSHRRAEIGGFLLGSVRRTGGVTLVTVEDFEEVPCAHAFGASYFLSGDEQRELAERVRRRRKGGASIVGFFRSNTRKEFGLTIEDLGLMQRHFSKPSMVLLLVHATADEPLSGGFAIWEQRAIRTTKPYGEFPFQASALESESDRIDNSKGARYRWLSGWRAALSGAVRTLDIRERFSPPPIPPLLRGRPRAKWLLATACLATALLGGVVYRGSRPPEVTVTVMPVHVDHDGSPFAPAVRRGPEAIAAGAAVAAMPPTEVPPKLVDTLPAASSERAATTVQVTAQIASRAAPFHIAPRIDAGAPALPPAPEVAMALPPSAALPAETSGTLPKLAATVPQFVSFAVEPLPYAHKGLLSRVSTHKNVRGATSYVPPRLIQQHSVDVPAELQKRLQSGSVPIAVKLYVGREGKVEYAELLSDGTGPNRELASLAVFASRKFQFSPAQEGSQTVPAEVLVRFRFGAAAER